MRSLIDIVDFSVEELQQLLDTACDIIENPDKYAPSGVYIMRIHGTFVNFLDLSPEIQQDIITRLDLKSTTIEC